MPRTLYAKLAAVLVALLATVGVLYAVIATTGTRHYLELATQRLNRDLARNLVRDRGLVSGGRIDREAIAETFRQYMTINPSIEIYLLDAEGRILSYSADPGKVKRRRVSLGPIRAFLAGGGSDPVLGDDPRSHDRRKVFSVTPVPSERDVRGYLYVVLRGEQFEAVERALRESYVLRSSAWAVVASLAVGLLAGLLVFRLLTRRIQRLAADMDAFAAARLGPAPAAGALPAGDEVERLRATFERMAARIAGQLEALERRDAWRRELVAQVSHDLRTPLAALHGYLETLRMKEGELGAEERREYLAVALRHSERLTRLVAELFELASLDARDAPPRREPFALADLAQDVGQKLALRAAGRGVALEVEAAPGLPLAWADIGLCERLLENLIANAIAHTPPGGAVRVSLGAAEGWLQVAVADTGAGIPEAELERIFEPFERGRRPTPGGSGLGLAIARRIVELHGGTIGARNLASGGAEIRFTLPVGRASPRPLPG